MIARKSLLMVFVKMSSQAVAFVGLFFVAHIMGPEPLGIIGFAMGFLGMFSILLYMGFEPAHIKRISEGKDFAKCVGTYAMIRIVTTIIFVIIVICGIFIWENLLQNEFTYEQKIVIYILLMVMAVESLNRIFIDTFTAERLAAKQEIPGLVRILVQSPLKVGIALGGFGVIGLASINLLGAGVFALATLFFFPKVLCRQA